MAVCYFSGYLIHVQGENFNFTNPTFGGLHGYVGAHLCELRMASSYLWDKGAVKGERAELKAG